MKDGGSMVHIPCSYLWWIGASGLGLQRFPKHITKNLSECHIGELMKWGGSMVLISPASND
jgi:hypothetical protein